MLFRSFISRADCFCVLQFVGGDSEIKQSERDVANGDRCEELSDADFCEHNACNYFNFGNLELCASNYSDKFLPLRFRLTPGADTAAAAISTGVFSRLSTVTVFKCSGSKVGSGLGFKT